MRFKKTGSATWMKAGWLWAVRAILLSPALAVASTETKEQVQSFMRLASYMRWAEQPSHSCVLFLIPTLVGIWASTVGPGQPLGFAFEGLVLGGLILKVPLLMSGATDNADATVIMILSFWMLSFVLRSVRVILSDLRIG